MDLTKLDFERAKFLTACSDKFIPKTDDELFSYMQRVLNITIPRTNVCPYHDAPFQVLADAYFARYPVIALTGARGCGKSFLLAALALLEQVSLGCFSTLVAASEEQSSRVLELVRAETSVSYGKFHDSPLFPKEALLVKAEESRLRSKFSTGGELRALSASPKALRGLHPARLRFDEADEMDWDAFKAALGQPRVVLKKDKFGRDIPGDIKIPTNILICSTHHLPNGTMTKIKQMGQEQKPPWQFRGYCLLPSEEVILANGTPEEIQNLNIEDKVLTGQGNIKNITTIFKRNISEEVCSIKVKGIKKNLKITKEHRIPTLLGWKQACELVPGDYVLTPKINTFDTENLTYNDGFILGLYLAEGSLASKGNGVVFSCHKNEINKYITKNLSKYKCNTYSTLGQGMDIYIYDKQFKEFITSHISGKDCYTKHLNKLNYSEEVLRGILDGWISGDGSGFGKGSYEGRTASKKLAYQMFFIGTTLHKRTGIAFYPNGAGPEARKRGEKFSGNFIYVINCGGPRETTFALKDDVLNLRDQGFSLSHIARYFNTDIGTIKKRINFDPDKEYKKAGCIVNKDGCWRLVKEISFIPYIGPVYDIEVEDDHTFIHNGVVVSNCYREVMVDNGGWVTEEMVDEWRSMTPPDMWEVEYELGAPSVDLRIWAPEKVYAAFDRKLGEFEGKPNTFVKIEDPCPGESYYHGVDWAKEIDWTVISTFRKCEFGPDVLVHWERMGRRSWKEMIDRYNEIVKTYPGPATHDSTGSGGVIKDFLTVNSTEFNFSARVQVKEMLRAYQTAIENGELKFPYIRWLKEQHEYAAYGDLFGTAAQGHLPDGIASAALAWYSRRKGLGEINIFRV